MKKKIIKCAKKYFIFWMMLHMMQKEMSAVIGLLRELEYFIMVGKEIEHRLINVVEHKFFYYFFYCWYIIVNYCELYDQYIY